MLLEATSGAATDLAASVETTLAKAIGDGIATDAVVAASQAQSAALWKLREGVSESQKREGASIKHDISVPVAMIPDFIIRATPAVLAHLQADAAAGRVGGTTAVCARDGRALYFSKSIIPHVASGTTPVQPVLLHVGLYAYRPAALADYVAARPAPLELQEGLEQLRFLDAGLPVGVAQCAAPAWDMIELNNPTDVPLIEAELARRALAESR